MIDYLNIKIFLSARYFTKEVIARDNCDEIRRTKN